MKILFSFDNKSSVGNPDPPWKMDHCAYLVKCSFDIIKNETKVLDTFNTDE